MTQQDIASPETTFGSAWLLRTDRDYERWMGTEGIPVHSHIGGFTDVTAQERTFWPRTGGGGCFLETLGTYQAESGIYVADIPPQKAIEPQHHLFPEALIVMKGRGSIQMWQRPGGTEKTFEWGPGRIVFIPQNTWYRLFNGSAEPVVYLSINKAPAVFNVLYGSDAIFNCDHVFTDLFDIEKATDFYSRAEPVERGAKGRHQMQTNFIPDVTKFFSESSIKGHNVQNGAFRMADRWGGHISQWGSGSYQKSHSHGPGAILTAFSGPGYVLMWPHEAGIHPYQDGYGDQVMKVDWGMHSIYVPYDGAYHGHFNASGSPARFLAFYGAPSANVTRPIAGEWQTPSMISTRKGGTLIDYEDEDPEIRRLFIETLTKNGVECTMPPVTPR